MKQKNLAIAVILMFTFVYLQKSTVFAVEQSDRTITGYPQYDEILQNYKTGLEAGWSIQEFSENGLCYLAGYDPSLERTGYLVTDLDQNGTEELLIGLTDSQGMFYDLYTLKDSEAVLVVSSGERDRYSLCTDGTIIEDGSGSALTSCFCAYDFLDSQLLLKEAVLYDGYYDKENPWFYSTSDSVNDHSNPISEQSARKIQERYEKLQIPFVPFSEISLIQNETTSGDSNVEEVVSNREIIQKACDYLTLPYIGNDKYECSLSCSDEGIMQVDMVDTEGLLGACELDVDDDGNREIFAVTYEKSRIDGVGKNTLQFILLKRLQGRMAGGRRIIANRELVADTVDGLQELSSMCDTAPSVYEGSVFIRKYKGKYQFFFEKFEYGVLATGQNWNLQGYQYEDFSFVPIPETEKIEFLGSEFDTFWEYSMSDLQEAFGTEAVSVIEAYRTLGFTAANIDCGHLTAVQEINAYPVVSLKRDLRVSAQELSDWFRDRAVSLDAFTYEITDLSAFLPTAMADAYQKEENAVQIIQDTEPGITVLEGSDGLVGDYVIWDSDSRYLDETDLPESTEAIQKAINEIYARHGRVFITPENDAYFRSKSWYQPIQGKADEEILAEFNEYERYNMEFLAKYL